MQTVLLAESEQEFQNHIVQVYIGGVQDVICYIKTINISIHSCQGYQVGNKFVRSWTCIIADDSKTGVEMK